MMRKAQRGFTLIELLVAALVLAVLSTGVLVTTWRLAAFAHEEAERLAAEAIATDIFWLTYNTPYAKLAGSASLNDKVLSDKMLPVIEIKDASGTVRIRRLLCGEGITDKSSSVGAGSRPKCTVTLASPSLDEKGRKRIKITVTLKWRSGKQGTTFDQSHVVEGYKYENAAERSAGGGV